MGYPQGLGQDTKLRWKAASDQDEDDRPSSALRRPHAFKVANPGLPVRPRSAYPPSDLPSTARSDSIPEYERGISDVSTLLEDTNPFGHIQSSMGRLSLQNSGGMSWKMPLRGVRGSTARESLEADDRSSESESDGSTARGSPPETHPPISIRSHVAAQLKKPDQDRNGMRIRRSHGFGPPETSSAKDLHTIRMEHSGHYLPIIAKEMDGNGSLPEHGNMTSYMRQRKQRSVFGEPAKIPGNGHYLSQNSRPTIKNFHPGQDAQMFPPVPRNHRRKEALDSTDGRYAAPRPGKKCHASTGHRCILPGVTEAKYKDPNAQIKGGSVSKFKPARPLALGERFDKNIETTPRNSHTPPGNARAPTYVDPYRAEQRPMEWIGHFNPDLDRAAGPGGIKMPEVHLNVSPPPPYAPYLGPIPMPNPPPMPPPPQPMMMVQHLPSQGLEGLAPAEDSPTVTGVQEAALPRASNKSHSNSSGAIDGTTGISLTISKDSSADECVRQARLLADMGERNQGPVPVAVQSPMPMTSDGENGWNPSRIFEQWNDSFGTPSAQSALAVTDPEFNRDSANLLTNNDGRNTDFMRFPGPSNPLATNDVLNDFDFDAFLHDNEGDAGGFDFSAAANFMDPEIGT